MKLEQIGFYTLSDQRAASATHESDLMRCELVLTSRCNFNCPYCRHVGGKDLDYREAFTEVHEWGTHGCKAIRFSGGEPLLYPNLAGLVNHAWHEGIERIAVSSNGSLPWARYEELLIAGVNDFSISLDACCAEDGDKMAGGIKGAWQRVVDNIRALAQRTYVTVGVVLTEMNLPKIDEIIEFAHSLGVADVRVIPAAQDGDRLTGVYVAPALLDAHPILAYRIANIQQGRPIRGLRAGDNNRCPLVLDDIAACGGKHYPCIIHMREGGAPIGDLRDGIHAVREQRRVWATTHNTHADPICSKNCLDVCVDYNNRYRELHNQKEAK